MKIIYITNNRVPTEKAYGYQICKMCEEFAMAGAEIELWIPARLNVIKEDVFAFYKLVKNFRIRKIKSFDSAKLKKYSEKLCFWLSGLLFIITLLFKKADKKNIIYTRNSEIGWLFSLKGHKTVFEAHNWPDSKIKIYKFLLKNVDIIVCNSAGTEKKFIKNGFNNTIAAPNGVDMKEFDINNDPVNLKNELNLLINKKIIMYVGHLYKWKGVEVIIKAAEILKKRNDIIFVLIGGYASMIKEYKDVVKGKKLSNILFIGPQHRKEIPKYLKCADILLLPNIPISQESIEYTSPIKMFEYMASKRPIIASDLPSIREILNDKNSLLAEPGNPNALSAAILEIFENPVKAKNIVESAYRDVQKYTWTERAKKILNFIES